MSFSATLDPYKVLDVPKDAPLAAIRSAHRRLVLTCHPDKVYDESVKAQKAEQFHRVQKAYEILSDETERGNYDRQAKQAELRSELMAERGGRRNSANDYTPRSTTSPAYEVRGDKIYEEVRPRRSYEDDHIQQRYEEVRPSRKYDDRYDERYEAPIPRRHSGRGPEEKRRPKEYEEEEKVRYRAPKESKVSERVIHSDRKKMRDKDRRRDHDSKRYQAKVDEYYDSDSDSTERIITPKRAPQELKRHQEDARRRERETAPRRSAKYEDPIYFNDLESKYHNTEEHAQAHIAKFSSRRPSVVKIPHVEIRSPTFTQVPPPPPPPPPPPIVSPSDIKRSSARSRGARETSRPSSSGRVPTEIVEPRNVRRPAMPVATSDPNHLRTPPTKREQLPRAATMGIQTEPRHPSMPRRAMTTPLNEMVNSRHTPMKSSNLRHEAPDSGYSSAATPEMLSAPSPQFTSSRKYRYTSSDEDDNIGTPRIISVEPDYIGRHGNREPSPRSGRATDRPPLVARTSSNARSATVRSSSHNPVDRTPRQPPLNRGESSRAAGPPPSRPRLFNEFYETPEYRVRNFAPELEVDGVAYARRGSEGSGRTRERERERERERDRDRDRDRDAYAYDDHVRPGLRGGLGSYRQELDAH